MNVLSLFDGMSCGQIALERSKIHIENYFASEIDKYAIQITKKNYPSTQHIGDVKNIKGIDLPNIDLLLGGSPCQGFSFSGKGLNFNDPRSKLFFEYVRLLNETRPKYFLFENVYMKKEWQNVISQHLGVEPIIINSNLVSAQHRLRYYWTNIPNITQPKDKKILLKDIIEKDKSHLGLHIDYIYNKNGTISSYNNISEIYSYDQLTTMSNNTLFFVPIDYLLSKYGLIKIGGLLKPLHKLWKQIKLGDKIMDRPKFHQGNQVYSSEGKSRTLTAEGGGLGKKTGLYSIEGVIRTLTKTECERLQNVPEGYTDGVSNTQAIKMLGNGWTVDVIAHILNFLKEDSFVS